MLSPRDWRERLRTLATATIKPLGLFWTLLFIGLCVASVYPIWRARHPPLQDLPQHLAAIGVLKNYPDLRLGEFFELQLSRTQYLAYYVLAQWLSYLLGVALANKLLLCAAIVALPLSLAGLLRALGRDPRLSLFAFGLTYNAHLILGFFNFLAALPLVFFGLTAAVRLRQQHTVKRMVVLGVLLLLCFYMHVMPFAFLGLGAVIVLVGDNLRITAQRGLPFIPVLIAAIAWLTVTPAGHATLAAAEATESLQRPTYVDVSQAIRDLPTWLTDVLHREVDDQLLVAWGALVLFALAVALQPVRRPQADEPSPSEPSYVWVLGLFSPLAFVGYFLLPSSYEWIWPIAGRLPLLSLLFLTLLLPRMRGLAGSAVLLGAALVALLSFYQINRSFVKFEREEVGDIDSAIATIPSGERVAGLIFGSSSNIVKFAPFLHYVALYQANKGGAVMFTFAEFPQSPFRFRPQARPPRIPSRWEWQPERVDPDRDLSWYRYVLVRGGPGRIQRSPYYENVFQGAGWTVWRRIDS